MAKKTRRHLLWPGERPPAVLRQPTSAPQRHAEADLAQLEADRTAACRRWTAAVQARDDGQMSEANLNRVERDLKDAEQRLTHARMTQLRAQQAEADRRATEREHAAAQRARTDPEAGFRAWADWMRGR